MEQFEQLLTCAICLDRYRIPKLLPCQHSFCMEPCMEGLVDYVRRQVKCPECRAEHRIPYQGVQGFPTNVTLQRFLELHIEITGELPDPTSGQVMERCNVCSEKAYCSFCQHCDKKICVECKGAHMDILRREISRINNQIRRGIHRLQDTLANVEKNTQNIQTNCLSVSEEVDEIYRRLSKALKDRTDHLRGELDKYLGTELRTLTNLKENLDQEISNILSNCDLADKHMTENVNWDDCELMDAKEIFLKTVDFIRNFEYETSDYTRKVRLILAHDPNQLVLHVAGFGDLNITNTNNPFNQSGLLQTPGAPGGLIRSKSDHRLATQFRQQEERGGYDRGNYGEGSSEEPSRKFGERGSRNAGGSSRYDRLGRGAGGETGEYGEDYDNETTRPVRSRLRSRYGRHGGDNDSDTEQSTRGVRFTEQAAPKERERVLDTEDVARGPLSGITRLADSPRVMRKLQENESGVKKKEKDPPPTPAPQPPKVVPKRPPPPANRQVSEEDEITRIKKQNKGATTSTTTPAETETRPVTVTPLKREELEERLPSQRKTPAPEAASSSEESDDSDVATLPQTQRKTPIKIPAPRRPSVEPPKKTNRSASSDSSSSDTSSGAVRSTGAAYTTEEVKQKILSRGGDQSTETPTRTRQSSTGSNSSKEPPKSTYQSRYGKPTVNQPAKVEETETSSDEESGTESDSEDTKADPKEVNKSDIGPLLARSALARDNSSESTRRINREEPVSSPIRSRYGVPREEPSSPVSKYTPRTRPAPLTMHDDDPPPSRYTSRFLNKSKSSAAVSPTEEEERPRFGSSSTANYDDPDKYATGRSRYMALKDRRQRLARSKSSHNFADDDDDNMDMSPTTSNPTAYLASRGYGSATSTSNDLARSRSTHALKSRENSPDRPTSISASASTGNNTEKDGAALSSWARYLKNKYGNRTSSKDKENGSPSNSTLATSAASSSAAARRLSLGLPLRSSAEMGSSDDDSKNMQGSPTTPTAATVAAQVGIAVAIAGISPKGLYQQKGQQLFEIGSRGSEPGRFTWPRGVACGPDNSIIIADSSNHRVQVFDGQGRFREEFGAYGGGEGEFDCLAGVAVNRIGQYIIADRYNHRIQVFDPSGRFLRTFGSQGTSDGRFNYPWGITTDALGFIYVCDKENHRVQVFQSDGTFVGKFGSMGNKQGQLEHPQYIAVSNTNRVVVSDCNNHRVQIFDVNGRVLSAFGSEGSADGHFKFPRGIAVDDQGYICVADSGNNRIQIFTPEGSFLRSFGGWGSRPGEFKGLEGVAISSNGYILVCDRENHRIQVF